jgi:hypothetical protein
LEEPFPGMGEAHQRSSFELHKQRQYSWLNTLYSASLQNLHSILARCFGAPFLLGLMHSLTEIEIISFLFTLLVGFFFSFL